MPADTANYAEKLRDLRERANLSEMDCATAYRNSGAVKPKVPGSKPSPTSHSRLEKSKKYATGTKIPYKYISALLPIMVGKGGVTAEELMELTDPPRALDLIGRVTSSTRLDSSHSARTVGRASNTEHSPVLLIRYRAEKEVYMTSETMRKRTYGVGPIVPADDLEGDQFCVLVSDAHANPAYREGTILHCLPPTEFDVSELLGKRVVLTQKPEGLDLNEVLVGEVTDVGGNQLTTVAFSGDPVEGELVGVVIGSYSRE